MRTLDYRARLIELASEINAEMPQYVVDKISDALNERHKSVRGSRILMIGVAYKRDIDDTRESPAIDILRLLASKGADVSFRSVASRDAAKTAPMVASETPWSRK